MKTISIPAIGGCPAHSIDPQNRAHVAALIVRADAMFELSRKAYIRANDSRSKENPDVNTAIENRTANDGAALLAPLGVSVDWPGLYPSFTVNGYEEHTTRAAVLAAVGQPRNWLPA